MKDSTIAKLIENNVALRLYKVHRVNGKHIGNKRDYANVEMFRKYGIETYHRYDREFYFTDKPTGTKAKLTFLNDKSKWEVLTNEQIQEILLI